MTWFSGAVAVNPAANDILADTGALAAGVSNVSVVVATSVAAIVSIEHRDAANTTTLHSQLVAVSGLGTLSCELPGVSLAANERIRLRNTTILVGSIQGSITVFN